MRTDPHQNIDTAPVDVASYSRRIRSLAEESFTDEMPTVVVKDPGNVPRAALRDDPHSQDDVDIDFEFDVDFEFDEEARSSGTRRAAPVQSSGGSGGPITPTPSLNHIPFLLVATTDHVWRDVDEAARGIAAFVDGDACVQTLVRRTGMPLADVLRVLGELTLRGVIGFR